jgi:hypothetical protein
LKNQKEKIMAKYDKIAKKISKKVTKQVTKKLTKNISKIIVASLDWQKIISAKTTFLDEDKPLNKSKNNGQFKHSFYDR